MSVAEIQNNKWELEATKAPITTPGSIGLMIMMGGFSLFFLWVIVGAVIGSFADTEEMDFDKVQREKPAEAAE